MKIWIRVWDRGEYTPCDSIEAAAAYLVGAGVHHIQPMLASVHEAVSDLPEGKHRVYLFWGDDITGHPLQDLNEAEYRELRHKLDELNRKARHDAIHAKLDEAKVVMAFVFVPWSQSRNAGEKYPSLNWKVTLSRDTRKILTTDYSAGCGHCPSYDQLDRSVDQAEMIRYECERGMAARRLPTLGVVSRQGQQILPDVLDVMHSLISDSDVLNYSSYEDWATNVGYDPDSRKGEAVYKDCMAIALKLRNGLGEKLFVELEELFHDY